MAVGGIEGIVITIGTPSCRFTSISVRTGEAGINGDFLNPLAEFQPEVFSIGIEPALVLPEIFILRHLPDNKIEKAVSLLRQPFAMRGEIILPLFQAILA